MAIALDHNRPIYRYNAYSNDVVRSLVGHIPTVVDHAHALTDRLAMLRNELYTVLQYTRTTASPGPIRGLPIMRVDEVSSPRQPFRHTDQ